MAVSGVSVTGSTSSLASSKASLAGNFDTFLQILTTQLKNQNPLDPMDTNQFTQQLVQFTSVEQQLKTNEYMQALLAANQSNSATDAVSFIGKSVTASGKVSELVNGKATWSLSLPEAAETATVTVTDKDGNVVHTEQGSMPAGQGGYSWDGIKSDGTKASPGSYTINITGTTASGGMAVIKTEQSGIVSGVDLTGDEPVLLVGTQRLPLSTVTGVKATA